MSESLKNLNLYLKLKARMEEKIAPSAGAVNLLPEPDFDFEAYFELIIPKDMPNPETLSRKCYEDQWKMLLYRARGEPTILALHMLLISYLRRQTPYTNHALLLFRRLWREHGFAFLEIVPTRDLISALRTFADHGETDEERLCAKLGFTYAHMLKIYESERKAEGQKLWRAGYKVPGGCPKIGLEGLWGILLGGDNSFEIINVVLAEEVEHVETIGPMILTILGRVQSGRTVFSRHDRARIGSGFNLDSERDWSFGFHPDQCDLEALPL